MASKWAKIIAKLPRYLGTEPDYQTKVDALKQEILKEEPKSASHFAQQYASVRKEKDELKNKLSEVQVRLEAYTQLLIQQYEDEDISNLRLASGESVTTMPEPYCVIENRDEFRDWCINHGYQTLMTLPWQTANSELKDRLTRGENEMPGTRAYFRTKIRFSGSKESDE